MTYGKETRTFLAGRALGEEHACCIRTVQTKSYAYKDTTCIKFIPSNMHRHGADEAECHNFILSTNSQWSGAEVRNLIPGSQLQPEPTWPSPALGTGNTKMGEHLRRACYGFEVHARPPRVITTTPKASLPSLSPIAITTIIIAITTARTSKLNTKFPQKTSSCTRLTR